MNSSKRYRHFGFRERMEMHALLVLLVKLAGKGDSDFEVVLGLLQGWMNDVCPHGLITVRENSHLYFFGLDGKCYHVNGAGLWITNEGSVSPRQWLNGFLRSRYQVRLMEYRAVHLKPVLTFGGLTNG